MCGDGNGGAVGEAGQLPFAIVWSKRSEPARRKCMDAPRRQPVTKICMHN